MTLAVLDHTARAIFYLLAVVCFALAAVIFLLSRPRADGRGPVADTVFAWVLVAAGLALAFVPPMVDAFDAA